MNTNDLNDDRRSHLEIGLAFMGIALLIALAIGATVYCVIAA